MGGEVVSMETRLAVALARRATGQRVPVRELCAELGISRQTFYVYERRYREEGVTGLLPRSRAPVRRPNRTSEATADAIVAWAEKLAEDGLDHGARSVWARMVRAGEDPPTPRTVHRVLVRRGLVKPSPQKRPRSSFRSFVAAQPNGCWQIDGMEWPLRDGSPRVIVRIIDDHSRRALASVVAPTESAAAAWATLEKAIQDYGPPVMLLSDNSLAFNGTRKGREVWVQRRLRDLGVATVTASSRHPQTCGKAEREHQTMQLWLSAHPAAESTAELQHLIQAYDQIYNQQRPHQALGDGLMTPEECYRAIPPAVPTGAPLPNRPRIRSAKVSARGAVTVGSRIMVQVGREWEGATVTVIRDGNQVAIFHQRTLILSRTIDPTRRYHGSGRRPSTRPLPRQPGARPFQRRGEAGVQVERPQRSEDERP